MNINTTKRNGKVARKHCSDYIAVLLHHQLVSTPLKLSFCGVQYMSITNAKRVFIW